MNIDRLDLKKIGWNEFFEEKFKEYEDKDLVPARIVNKQKNKYLVYYNNQYIQGKLAGKFRYKVKSKEDFPAVGDWVIIQFIETENKSIIHGVLERKTSFVRKATISGGRKIQNGKIVGGTPEAQVIASNMDTVFIVSGLDGNFNIKRIERYITLVYNSGAQPVIILNKIDLCDDVDSYIDEVENVAIGIPIYPISVIKEKNMDIFDKYLLSGKTIVFLGSSGVGKSTITNYLLGDYKQKVNSTSNSNGKGKHTTTSVELLFHSSGCMTIDTPGLKGLELWGTEEAIEESFEDVIELIQRCNFNDCKHDTEPGCAIKKAIEEGSITKERYESYNTQVGEIRRVSKWTKKSDRHFSRQRKISMHSYSK